MAPKTRRGLRQHFAPSLLVVLASTIGVVVVSMGLYTLFLDRKIVRQFEGRRWDLPAQVYARPMEIYGGLRLAPADLESELLALGYTATGKASAQGTFSRNGLRITVFSRPFTFWDGAEPGQRARIRFDGKGVTGLTDSRGQELALLRLDPPFIGNIFTTHSEDRIVLGPDQVPLILLRGLKVVEDRDFNTHSGVSLRAIARALWVNVRAGEIEQGGSTLTQQLVRSYFLDNSRTLSRKLREALMSVLLELHFEKADILNAYINEIYLGQAGNRAIHGFGLASQFYFGKPLNELQPQHIALLIAVVRGPSYYDPRRHPDRVRERRNRILGLLAEFNVISLEAGRKAQRQTLGVRGNAITYANYNPSFMDLVRRELRANYQEEDLQNAGLRIMTTLDPRIQSAAEQGLLEGLAKLETQRKKPAGGLDGAIIVTGTQTPDVMAVVGGRNTRLRGFNRALDAKRPIGSLVKPLVYLAGFESGQFTAASLLEDAPLTVKLDGGKTWTPQNYDKTYRGPVPAVRALAESLNTPTVRVGMAVGPRRVATLLGDLGLKTPPRPRPSLLLGALALAPIEVAQIYNSLANGGFLAPLKTVRAVIDESGKPLERYPLKIKRAADPAAVQELNSAMTQVVARGTGREARSWLPPNLVVAGKTGTSDDLRDSWFAGFTNDHVAVVWVGADDNSPTGLTGASGALPVWARLVGSLNDTGYSTEKVSGLENVSFDFTTGIINPEGCGDPVTLPLPVGTVLPSASLCGAGLDNPGDHLTRGIEWLEGLVR